MGRFRKNSFVDEGREPGGMPRDGAGGRVATGDSHRIREAVQKTIKGEVSYEEDRILGKNKSTGILYEGFISLRRSNLSWP